MQAEPLYTDADDSAKAGEARLTEDIGRLLAARMKAYVDGNRAAGLTI
jgi:hypothetical protein